MDDGAANEFSFLAVEHKSESYIAHGEERIQIKSVHSKHQLTTKQF